MLATRPGCHVTSIHADPRPGLGRIQANFFIMSSHTCRAILRILVAALGAATAVMLLRAADRPAIDPEPIAQALVGVWVHVGEPGDVSSVPLSGGRLKFRMGHRWTLTHADPANGTVREHFGGTYQVHGNEYSETIDYSVDANDPELGKTLKFRVKVEGDTMTQTGIGNPYTEVWKRVR